MFKKIAAALIAMMFAVASFAAVDANKGTAAELDGLKGIGPAMSKRIIDARTTSQFKDWPDLMSRVKGVKAKTATKLSKEGLTINGEAFKGGTDVVPSKSTKAAKP
jgi:competence protein ComEA